MCVCVCVCVWRGGGVRDHSPQTDLVNGTQARYFSSGCRRHLSRHLSQCVQWMEKPPVSVCPAKQVRPSVETVAVKRMTVKNGHSHCCKNGHSHYCKNGHRHYCKNGHRHYCKNGHSHYCKNGHSHYCRDGSGRRAALRRSHYDHCSIRPQALFFAAPQALFLLHHRQCFCCTTGSVFAAPQAVFCCTTGTVFAAPQAVFLLHHRPCFCCTTGTVFAAPQALFLLHHRHCFCCTTGSFCCITCSS